jgi:hypothetical protein
MKEVNMKLELAKAGSFNGVTLTPEDLRSMAENFVSDVPVTIGHVPDDSLPAYGWVKSAELSPDALVLYGIIELGAELAEAFAEGKYKNWSIGAARNEDDSLYLHHVAFLGAVPPMIKGLKVIEMGDISRLITFASAGCGIIFSDIELAEYSKLKTEKLSIRTEKLKKAAEGKLPFAKAETLMRLAENIERTDPELNFSHIMAEIFSAVKEPVTRRTAEQTTAPRNIFSKI